MAVNLSAIDWPKVTLGGQTLEVRWTFYVQYLLSTRKVPVKAIVEMSNSKDPGLVAVLMECFAAAVAENYTAQGITAPGPDHWAQIISSAGPEAWKAVNTAIWEAVKKAPSAAEPAPKQPTTETPGAQPLAN